MPALTADDKQLIKSVMYGMSVEVDPISLRMERNKADHNNEKIQTATIAKLYMAPPANPGQWISASLEGAIVLLKDKRQNNAYFFKLVDMVVHHLRSLGQ